MQTCARKYTDEQAARVRSRDTRTQPARGIKRGQGRDQEKLHMKKRE